MTVHRIFPQLYFSYKQENHLQAKQQLLEKYDVARAELDGNWNCNSTRIHAAPGDILPIITPALKSLGHELKKSAKIFIVSCWINFYKKGSFQELHNHAGGGCQLALVYFLNYEKETDGRFYFYDTNTEMVSNDLTTLFSGAIGSFGSVLHPNVDEGDVLIFPSYLHHGVGPHNGEGVRITVSCNLSFRQH